VPAPTPRRRPRDSRQAKPLLPAPAPPSPPPARETPSTPSSRRRSVTGAPATACRNAEPAIPIPSP